MIIIIILLIIYIYAIKLCHPDYKSVFYSDIKDRVKSGDIILFSALDSLHQICMGSYYTHIGVIYRENPTSPPILIESFNNFKIPHPKKFKNGIATCDLENRINSYRGYIFYKQLDKPISDQANKDFAEFIKYSRKNLKYDENPIENEIGKILFNTPFSTGINCGQFTTLILIKLGLISFSNFRDRKKHHLRYTANLTKLKKNSYREPVYITHRYFKIAEV